VGLEFKMAKKAIKLIKLSKQQEVDIRQSWESDKSENKPRLNELIESNRNHTLSILRSIKNLVVWKDIEDMVDFVNILKICDTDKDSILLEERDVELCKRVLSDSSKTGKVLGSGMELFISVYQTFNNAI
jgi:hypothetical protein